MLAESQALITFAERIRECQLDRYGIHVPQIAVVGAQSSGKSSVLESITGIPFPRDAALCTRGPMEVRLKMCTDPDEEGIDVFRTEQDRRKFRLGEEQSPAFAEHLQTVVQSVMTGLESKFTDEVIIVEVRRVNQIPFTVIDLPGYYQYTDEENDADVADCEKVHDINHAYIAQDATIILHVIPASQDPATLESWKVCNKVDRSHQRTIQVLTKLDIAPRDLEKAWLGRIAGAVDDQYSKAMALHVLRCRAGHEIEAGMTLPELHEEEARLAKRWLNDATAMTPLGCTPPTDCFGQTSLVQALSRLLVARIQANLPAIRAQIQRQLDATIMQLESLGEPLDTTHAKRKLLNTLRAAVRRGIDSVTAGSPLNQLSSEPMSIWECLNMLEDVMQGSIAECLDRWLREDLVALEMSNADTEMKFARIKSSDITAERLATKLASAKATAMRREDTISDAAGLTTWSTHEQPIAETKRAVPPAAHDQVARPKRAVPAAARDQIAHLIRMRRSHRLSGFLDFGLFSGIVDNVLARSRQHMQQFCQCVAALVSHVLSHILNPRFNVVHPNNAAMQALQGHVLESAMRRFQECCDEVISDMAKVCLNETSPSRATIVAQAVDTTTANGEFVDAKELLQLLKAYWSYSSRRLADNVALTCRRAFIKQFLQHKIEATLDDIGDATLEAVACEAPHTVARRAALQEACQAYERALEIIEGASVVLG